MPTPSLKLSGSNTTMAGYLTILVGALSVVVDLSQHKAPNYNALITTLTVGAGLLGAADMHQPQNPEAPAKDVKATVEPS